MVAEHLETVDNFDLYSMIFKFSQLVKKPKMSQTVYGHGWTFRSGIPEKTFSLKSQAQSWNCTEGKFCSDAFLAIAKDGGVADQWREILMGIV